MAMGGAAGDKGDGRGLWGQGCVFADFMRSCWLSEGCGRRRRPCPRLLHGEPCTLAVVTAFSLKLAAVSADVVGGSEGSAASVAYSEHSEHSEHSAGVGAGVAVSAASVADSEHSEHSEHSASAGAGVALSVVGDGVGGGVAAAGGGVAAARI